METFRYQIFIVSYEKTLKKSLMARMMAQRKDKGKLWARTLLSKTREGERQLIQETNSFESAEFVCQDLSAMGAQVEIVDLFPNKGD